MKRKDEIKEFRGLGIEDLGVRAQEAAQELMKLRFRQSGPTPLEKPSVLKVLRRRIARATTIARQKRTA